MNYIDLGLPSGTLWSYYPIVGRINDVKHFGKIPSIEQWKELIEYTNLSLDKKMLYSTINRNYIPISSPRLYLSCSEIVCSGVLLGIKTVALISIRGESRFYYYTQSVTCSGYVHFVK